MTEMDRAEQAFERRDWARAEEAYRLVLNRQPDNNHALARMARVLEEQGRFEEAREAAQRALELAETLVDAHIVLGRVRYRRGDRESAQVQLNRALALDKGNQDAQIALGALLVDTKRFREAVTLLEEARQQHPASASIALNLGGAYLHLGDPNRAAVHLQAAWKMAPHDPDTKYTLGSFFFRQGQYSDARPLLEKAVSLLPGSFDCQTLMGQLDAREGRAREARSRFIEFSRTHSLTVAQTARFFWTAPPGGLVAYVLLTLAAALFAIGLILNVPLREVGLGLFLLVVSFHWLWYRERYIGLGILFIGTAVILAAINSLMGWY